MPLRKRKPTSAGRRFQTVSDFSEVTKTTPERTLVVPRTEDRPGATPTAASRRATSGGGHKRQYRIIDFKRIKDGMPAKVAAIEYDPNRTCRIALLHYADGDEGVHPRPEGPQGRRPRPERPGLRHQAGLRAAVALHPGRHHRAQRRAAAGPGRQGRPFGRHERAARRQGGRLRQPAHAVDRDAPRPDRLPGHGRRGRQLRARADQDRQGRAQPLEGRSPPDRAASS